MSEHHAVVIYHVVTYRYAGEQHSLHFCVVDTFT